MRDEEYGTISDQEVGEAMSRGEVVPAYPDDRPHPSVLMVGLTAENRPL
jgi:hypothetical protein